MNLKLLSKLQGSDSVNLVLVQGPGNILNYYLISRSVSYDIVCSGKIGGNIGKDMVSFDIRMASIIPLIDKGWKFDISYVKGELSFVCEEAHLSLTPSYVETNDAKVSEILNRYLDFNSSLENKSRVEEQITELNSELEYLENNYNHLFLMNLSGGPTSNPFDPYPGADRVSDKYLPEINAKKKQLSDLQKNISGLTECDLGVFIPIASAAARSHNLVDMCETYAIVDMTTSFLLQKGACPTQSIQGQLFYQLLRDGSGKGFYIYKDELIYVNGKDERVVVFIQKYLPGNSIDSSIVTKGAVVEKYIIKLKGLLNIASVVKSHFPKFSMNMGDGNFILSNDLGERITIKFDVEDAKTVQLMKYMKGSASSSSITMAVIDIPKEVQQMLNLFRDRLTIYVKSRKIIFQNEGLYLVFGR